ncbi:hypothetical protein [Leucobacter salsicius]|uniref:hypothetical protein n=1 Tax=Leucobacter salsicius TaxID=664638 RepID=UPI0012FC4937|nr:hypothetical protein [Leucobacter salsicius]
MSSPPQPGGGVIDPSIEAVFIQCGFYSGFGKSGYPATPSSCGAIPYASLCPALPDRSAVGWINVWKNGWTIILGEPTSKQISSYCVYPTESVERSLKSSAKIYTGAQGDFRQSRSIATASRLGGGTLTDTTGYVDRGADLTRPSDFAGAWTPRFDASTGTTANGDPLYGFYGLSWKMDYRLCETWAYQDWVNEPPSYDCSRAGADTSLTGYTYACDTTPPLQEGLREGALFDPAACTNGQWECSTESKIKISGQTGPLSVMRNGEPLAVGFSPLTITGDVLKKVRAEQVKVTLADGSTPINPQVSDPNSKQQYFDASWAWGEWVKKESSDIRFHWASEKERPFHFSSQYRFTGDFKVKKQGSLSSGVQTVWATDTASCGSSKSPKITVLRAVSRNG